MFGRAIVQGNMSHFVGAPALSDRAFSPSLPQEVPDYLGERTEAAAKEDAEALAAAKDDVQNRSRAWLKRKGVEEEQQWRPRKRHRKTAAQWLRDFDSLLQSSTGASLSHFQQAAPINERAPPMTWRGLSVACDMEASQHTAIMAAQRFFRLNIDYTPDPSHGAQRCILDALKKTGLLPYSMTTMLCRAIPHGPWAEDIRFRQAALCIREHLEFSSPANCPLFQSLAVSMCLDSGDLDMLGGEDGEMELWESLASAEPWTKKGCKGTMNRFMSVIREQKELDRNWHKVLYGYLITALQMDMLKGKELVQQLKSLTQQLPNDDGGDGDGGEGASSSMRRPTPADKAVRAAGCNAMVGGVMFLLHPDAQQIGRVILSAATTIDQWHSAQNKALRDVQSSRRWFCDQVAGGAFLEDIGASWTKLADIESLEYCMFETRRFPDLEPRHPQVVSQDEVAGQLGSLLVALAASRLRKFLWMVRGWPANIVRWTAGSDAHRRQAVRLLKEDYEAFVAISGRTDAPSRRLAERSVFNTVPVQQAVELLKATGWVLTQPIIEKYENKHARLLGSQVIEDGVNRQRRVEQDRRNRRGTARAAFQALIEHHVGDQVHHFKPLEVEAKDFGAQTVLPEKTWRSSIQAQSMSFDDIVSTSSRAPYVTTAPYDYATLFADLHLTTALHKMNRFDELQHLDMLQPLLRGEGLLVRQKVAEGGRLAPFLLSLGSLAQTAAPAWRMTETKIEGTNRSFFTPCSGAACKRMVWVIILQAEEFEATTFKWRSPLWQRLQYPQMAELPIAVRAVQDRGLCVGLV